MSKNLLELITAICVTLIVLCPTARASDFTLSNDIRSPIVGFYTLRPNGSWSPNWLSGPLPPGRHTGMTFGSSAVNAACVRNYRIVTSGAYTGSVDRTHDFCKYHGLHLTASGPTHTEK